MLFSWDYLLHGFVTAFSVQNLLWAFIGCMIGTLIGVLPGIGPFPGIAYDLHRSADFGSFYWACDPLLGQGNMETGKVSCTRDR